MNNNQTTSKPDPKGKAMASLILGMISVIPFACFMTGWYLIPKLGDIGGTLAFFGFPIILVVSISGIFLGVISLKSDKTTFKLSLCGIILSVIGLVGEIYLMLLGWFFSYL